MKHYLRQAHSCIKSKESMIFKIILIMVSMGLIVFLYGGILAGMHREWFSVVFFLFIFVFGVNNIIDSVLILKVDSCFKRLENVISNKSVSLLFENLPKYKALNFFMVVFYAVLLSLSILTGTRQCWLILCLILVALTVTNYLTNGLMLALRIKAYSKSLEELICKTKCDEEPKELIDE